MGLPCGGADRGDVVVVGDSIFDVRAAHAIGARSVAVCTGWTDAAVLAQERPTLLLEELDPLADWLVALDILPAQSADI